MAIRTIYSNERVTVSPRTLVSLLTDKLGWEEAYPATVQMDTDGEALVITIGGHRLSISYDDDKVLLVHQYEDAR